MVSRRDDQVQVPDPRRPLRHLPEPPKICSEYTTDNCEYDDDWLFEKVFETPEQIWEYAEAILPPRKRKKAVAGPVVTQIGDAS